MFVLRTVTANRASRPAAAASPGSLPVRVLPPTDEDRNFALEEYAASSKCFEHTRLWEERTCHKVRQWQHWGSGCYQHACLAGR